MAAFTGHPGTGTNTVVPKIEIQVSSGTNGEGGFPRLLPPKASSMTPSPGRKLCRFFLQGACRNGADCRFSHDNSAHSNSSSRPSPTSRFVPNNSASYDSGSPSASSPHQTFSPPPRAQPMPNYRVPQLLNQPIFSIDVECVATGVEHSARAVAQIAVVDQWCRPVLNVFVKQEVPVMSYITPLTGLTKEILDANGCPLGEALAMLRSVIPQNAVIVGQNILQDIQWLRLTEGVDFHSLVDIAGLFRMWNPARGEYTMFSQDHCAQVWLGMGPRPHHNAVDDACISMTLFNAYRSVQDDPARLQHLQMATLAAERVPGFSSRFPEVDGCCMGNRKKCTCKAPFN